MMIEEIMQGTCLLIRSVAVASKLGKGLGWKVKAINGTKPFPSSRFGAKPGEMTNILMVKNKREARKALVELEKSNGLDS